MGLYVGFRRFLVKVDDDALFGLGLIALRATVVFCMQYTATIYFLYWRTPIFYKLCSQDGMCIRCLFDCNIVIELQRRLTHMKAHGRVLVPSPGPEPTCRMGVWGPSTVVTAAPPPLERPAGANARPAWESSSLAPCSLMPAVSAAAGWVFVLANA